MTTAIPVIDLEAAEDGDVSQLDAMRAATEELGAVQVVNHGVPQDLAADLAEYGRPDQIAAWRDGQPYVAELADNSAGR